MTMPISSPLPLGAVREAPAGWASMVATHPDEKLASSRQVELDDISLIALLAVRQAVSDNWHYIPDPDRDIWNATATGTGDCEDWCLAVRRKAAARGLPRDAFRIAVCRNPAGIEHAVLAVATDHGDFVLDISRPGLWAWQELPYRWLAIEVAGGGWRTIDVPVNLADLSGFGQPTPPAPAVNLADLAGGGGAQPTPMPVAEPEPQTAFPPTSPPTADPVSGPAPGS
jgi:predicted transglutaminase-like cysteine proteinase